MPSWEQFQRQHVLDPTKYLDYASWDRQQWNNWLRERLGGAYGTKFLNSVVIATPAEVMQAFENPASNVTHAQGPDFYWSEGDFHIYVLELVRSSGDYRVFNLDRQYFLAKIYRDPNAPVHYHGQGRIKVEWGQLEKNFTKYPQVQ